MSGRRTLSIIAVLVLSFGLISCERQKIGDINSDPGRYFNKEVNVAGRVTNSFGFMGRGIHQIDDGTGHLWVLVEQRGVPSNGAVVGVKGRTMPTVTFMGHNYATVVRESDRRAAKAED